jgi:two-component system CheB/CheR fusion protein
MTELEAMRRLHALATRFVRSAELPSLLAEAVDVATAITGAEAGHIQILGGAPVGRFPDATAGVPIETPLRGHSGNTVGVLVTHHCAERRPDAGQLRLLGLLASQCADAIETTQRLEERAEATARAHWGEKLRESEELFRTTVENMPLAMTIIDRGGNLLYMNPVLAAFIKNICHGKDPQSFIGGHSSQVWPERVWTPLQTSMERAIGTGEKQTFDVVAPLPNGESIVRQWTVVPLAGPDGEVRRVMTMSQDVTAQRRLVEELRQADRRKSEFIAVLSHELRNPLAAIRTSLFLLEHAPPGEITRGAQEAIDRQVDHLVRMVDDLLDVNRIEQSKIQLQRSRVDLNQIVRETIQDNREHLERGGVRLEMRLAGAPVTIDADRARISQVVTNLLSNAAKFTLAGGTTCVSVADDGHGCAVLTVTDTGVGIDPALLPQLFQPFRQADSTLDRAGGGLGLGLALVKGLVELQGGEVTASSGGQGLGAEFVVRFPLASAPTTAEVAAVVAGRVTTPLRVLVVEDDADIANGLRAVLELDAHEVAIARNGRDAITEGQRFRADVVLCDIGLPGMDGYQVARAFRADEQMRATFLIALSGYAQAEDLARSRAAGFDEHLAKPVRIDKIQRLLSTIPRRPA